MRGKEEIGTRYDKIQTEVLTSHKKNIKIDLTWHDLDEKEDCE